jgi:hypothetical protein
MVDCVRIEADPTVLHGTHSEGHANIFEHGVRSQYGTRTTGDRRPNRSS